MIIFGGDEPIEDNFGKGISLRYDQSASVVVVTITKLDFE